MKIIKGTVVSIKMKDTIVIEVSRRVPHPLYRKLLKRSSKFKVSAPGHSVSLGEVVSAYETKPIAKAVHFKLMEKKVKEAKK